MTQPKDPDNLRSGQGLQPYDPLNDWMKDFTEWYDQPKTTQLHKEGWKYYHAQLKSLLHQYINEARIDELEKLLHDVGDLPTDKEWNFWAYRVIDYLKNRLPELKSNTGGK